MVKTEQLNAGASVKTEDSNLHYIPGLFHVFTQLPNTPGGGGVKASIYVSHNSSQFTMVPTQSVV